MMELDDVWEKEMLRARIVEGVVKREQDLQHDISLSTSSTTAGIESAQHGDMGWVKSCKRKFVD